MRRRYTALALVSASLASCAPAANMPSPRAAPAATGSAPSSPSPSPAGPSLAGCPSPQGFAGLAVLAQVPDADDLAAAADGSLWVSGPDLGRLTHVGASGRVLTAAADPRAPEGIVLRTSAGKMT